MTIPMEDINDDFPGDPAPPPPSQPVGNVGTNPGGGSGNLGGSDPGDFGLPDTIGGIPVNDIPPLFPGGPPGDPDLTPAGQDVDIDVVGGDVLGGVPGTSGGSSGSGSSGSGSGDGGSGTPTGEGEQITWSVGYELEGAPDWWQGMIPSHWNAQTEYASLLNNMLPFMSPEDQRTIATSLFMMYPESFAMYNPESVSYDSPTGGTLGLSEDAPTGADAGVGTTAGFVEGEPGGALPQRGVLHPSPLPLPQDDIVWGPDGAPIPIEGGVSIPIEPKAPSLPKAPVPPFGSPTGEVVLGPDGVPIFTPTPPDPGNINIPSGGYDPTGPQPTGPRGPLGQLRPPPYPSEIAHVPAEQGVPVPLSVYGGGGIPDDISDQLKEQYYSSGRGQAMLEALERMRLAAGVEADVMGPGYAYMRAVADTIRDFGGTPGQGQTRTQYGQMMGAMDPLLAQNQNENLQPFATAARSLLQPYFSAGQLMPVQLTESGMPIYGTPEAGFF